MEKRGLFYAFSVIFILYLIPNAYSIYEEKVYSGTVEDKDLIEAAGNLFKFRIDSVSSKVNVEIIDDVGAIIPSGQCKITGNFNICVSNISFSYRNLTDYINVYKTNVNIYQIKSKLDITNSIVKDKILIDEETTAELTFENTADLVAKDVLATMEIPPFLSILEVEGCKKSLNTLIFEEDVHPKQIKKCSYKVKGLYAGDIELQANVAFFDGVKNVNTTSNKITGKVYNRSLKINYNLNKSKFDINEKFDLTINIKNINDQYEMRVTNFNIKIPQKLLILKTPKGATKNNQIINWIGTLAPNEEKDFLVQLQGLRTGNYSILTEANYKINLFSRVAKTLSNIELSCNCPFVQHDFSQGIAVANQRVGLKAYITNPHKKITFRSVEISYSTNIPNIQDFSTAYSQIIPFETINIFDSSIITPPLDEIYHFNITAIYKSSSNQVFVEKDNIIIKIPQVEDIQVDEKESIDEETPLEEEQEVEEEKQQQAEEVLLEPEENIEDIDESEKEESKENFLILQARSLASQSTKAYGIIGFILTLILILVIVIIIKRKRNEKRKKGGKKETKKKKDIEKDNEAEKQKTNQFLSSIRLKDDHKEEKTPAHQIEDEGFEDLEKQVNEIGNIFEKEKELQKIGFFRRIFRRK